MSISSPLRYPVEERFTDSVAPRARTATEDPGIAKKKKGPAGRRGSAEPPGRKDGDPAAGAAHIKRGRSDARTVPRKRCCARARDVVGCERAPSGLGGTLGALVATG